MLKLTSDKLTEMERPTRRPKRQPIYQVELGGYPDGSTKRFVAWIADYKDVNARLGVVQKINTTRLSNEKENPVLAKKLCDESNTREPCDVCPHAYRFAQNALYQAIAPELGQLKRPIVRIKYGNDKHWCTLGDDWREVLDQSYGLRDISEIVESFTPRA
jgi:hypothetical protein